MGGESRKYCTHFIRLHTEGIHLIDKDQVFDLFPSLGMPGKEKATDAMDSAQESENREPEANSRPSKAKPS